MLRKILMIGMILIMLISSVNAQENVTNVSITGFETYSDTFTDIGNSFLANMMIIFLIIFSLLVILYLKIPILLIFIGALTSIMAWTITDIVFYPFFNIIITLFGVYEIMKAIRMTK